MSTFTLTLRAKSDLKFIAKFTEDRWGRVQRNIYIKQFDEAFHMLAGPHQWGKTVTLLRSGIINSLKRVTSFSTKLCRIEPSK